MTGRIEPLVMDDGWTGSRPTSDLVSDLPHRVNDLASRWAELARDRPALIEKSGHWTYGELPAIVAEARRFLGEAGIRPGDRVMVVAENCRALVALLLAAWSLDSWAAIVNARLSEREVDQIRKHSGARRVLYTVAVSAHARGHAERHGATNHETRFGRIALGPLNAGSVPEAVERDGARQVAALIYTSGTTGHPKGVMLTHRNLLFVAKMSGMLRSLGPEDRVLGVLPISHILGLSVVLLGSLYHGASLHLAPRFDPSETLAALARGRLTFMLGAPGMYALLGEYAKAKGIPRIEAPGLRVIASAGAPLDSGIKESTERLLGLPLNNGYGVTEMAPTVSQTLPDRPRPDLSVGPLWPGVEAKLVGQGGRAVPEGEIGELHVRGPNLMKGYYRAPEDTDAAIDEQGWLNTRDLARFEDDHLFIVGRAQELIVRFGFNVYPPEVEAVLNAHPAVTQSAVIGRPVAGSEDILAFVQTAPGASVTVAQLTAHAAASLAPYKRPSTIFLVSKLPAGPTGKILKSALPALAEELARRG